MARAAALVAWPLAGLLLATAACGGPAAPPSAGAPAAATTAPPARFTDVAADAGLANAVRTAPADPAAPGGGAALIDADHDGDLDIVVVGARPAQVPGGRPSSAVRLYVNDGQGRFTDRTAAAALDVRLDGVAVAAGDFDNDGWADLFVTGTDGQVLLENVGGRFHDITRQAGVAARPGAGSRCALWFDADADGDLDLFVCATGRSAGPWLFYVNQGDGRFVERAAQSGLAATAPPSAPALSAVLAPLDTDACPDVLVTRDGAAPHGFRNSCTGTFTEVRLPLGSAVAGAAGGLDITDAENGVDSLLAVTGGVGGAVTLARRSGDGGFAADGTVAPSPGTRPATSVLFFDYDLDGRVDLLTVGEPAEGAAAPSPAATLYWNTGLAGNSRFTPVTDTSALAAVTAGRGAAFGDIDGDGDLDLLLVPATGPVRLLRNDLTGARWFRLRLVGTASPQDATGAIVEVTAGGRTRRRIVTAAHGYLSQSELPLTFGLAPNDAADATIRITWPSGAVQSLSGVALGQTTTVTEVS